jgi:hypothetical protein
MWPRSLRFPTLRQAGHNHRRSERSWSACNEQLVDLGLAVSAFEKGGAVLPIRSSRSASLQPRIRHPRQHPVRRPEVQHDALVNK